MRRYANAVYAVVLRPSVPPYVRPYVYLFVHQNSRSHQIVVSEFEWWCPSFDKKAYK